MLRGVVLAGTFEPGPRRRRFGVTGLDWDGDADGLAVAPPDGRYSLRSEAGGRPLISLA